VTRAPQLQWLTRQADACVTPRWNVNAAGQACGRIKLDAFDGRTHVADMLHAITGRVCPDDGAAS